MSLHRLLLALLFLVAVSMSARAHEVRPAYLELTQTSADSFNVLWKVPAMGDNLRLRLYLLLTC